VPHSATFIFIIFLYVIASIAYIHPVYGARVRTHDLLIVSRLPQPLDQASRLDLERVIFYSSPNFNDASPNIKIKKIIEL
jgi:hypothetical protein